MSRQTAFCAKAVISIVQGLVGFLLTVHVVCFLIVAGCGYVTWDTPLGLISPGSVYGLFWISSALLACWLLLDGGKALWCLPVPREGPGDVLDVEMFHPRGHLFQ